MNLIFPQFKIMKEVIFFIWKTEKSALFIKTNNDFRTPHGSLQKLLMMRMRMRMFGSLLHQRVNSLEIHERLGDVKQNLMCITHIQTKRIKAGMSDIPITQKTVQFHIPLLKKWFTLLLVTVFWDFIHLFSTSLYNDKDNSNAELDFISVVWQIRQWIARHLIMEKTSKLLYRDVDDSYTAQLLKNHTSALQIWSVMISFIV